MGSGLGAVLSAARSPVGRNGRTHSQAPEDCNVAHLLDVSVVGLNRKGVCGTRSRVVLWVHSKRGRRAESHDSGLQKMHDERPSQPAISFNINDGLGAVSFINYSRVLAAQRLFHLRSHCNCGGG